MAVDAGNLDMRHRRRRTVEFEGALDIDTELVLTQPGRDVGMGASVDIRIDAQ